MISSEQEPPCVLVTNLVPREHLEPLSAFCKLIDGPGAYELMSRQEVLRVAHQVHAIINQAELKVDAELLNAAPKLRIVANVASGVDNLDLEELSRRGIWATNVPDAFVNSTADHTIGLLLAVARGIVQADKYVRSGNWERDGLQPSRWDGMELAGKTWGTIGYGRIGRAVQKRASAFGMQTVFTAETPYDDSNFRPLDVLLACSDIVSLHVPLSDTTTGLMNQTTIRQMKPGAILLNLSRGRVVDEQAMIEALHSGHLAGAGLDVFQDEPVVQYELMKLPNVVMTPHIGGGTAESRRRARRICAENVSRVLRGNTPLTPVNAPTG